jgi:hypothetical protein
MLERALTNDPTRNLSSSYSFSSSSPPPTVPTSQPIFNNNEDYQLLYTMLSNVTERLELSFNDTYGISMQLSNVSTHNATVYVFKSDALTPSKAQLKNMVQLLLNKTLPTVNELLRGYPLPFPKQAVPFTPNPSLTTVSTANGGYVQASWACDCESDQGGWQRCQDKNVVANMMDTVAWLHQQCDQPWSIFCDFDSIKKCQNLDCDWIKLQIQEAINNYPPSSFECQTSSQTASMFDKKPTGGGGQIQIRQFSDMTSESASDVASSGDSGEEVTAPTLPQFVVTVTLFATATCDIAHAGAAFKRMVGIKVARSNTNQNMPANECLIADTGAEAVMGGSRYYKLYWRASSLVFAFGCSAVVNSTNNCDICTTRVTVAPNKCTALPAANYNTAGCPPSFPYRARVGALGNFSSRGRLCYNNPTYASAGSGAAWSWCAVPYRSNDAEFMKALGIGLTGELCESDGNTGGLVLTNFAAPTNKSSSSCEGGTVAIDPSDVIVSAKHPATCNWTIKNAAMDVTNLGSSGSCVPCSFAPPFCKATNVSKGDNPYDPTGSNKVRLYMGCYYDNCTQCRGDAVETISGYPGSNVWDGPIVVELGRCNPIDPPLALVVQRASKMGELSTCPPSEMAVEAVVEILVGVVAGVVVLATVVYLRRRPTLRERIWTCVSGVRTEICQMARTGCEAGYACWKEMCARSRQTSIALHADRTGLRLRFLACFALCWVLCSVCGIVWYFVSPLDAQLDKLEQNEQFSTSFDDSRGRALFAMAKKTGLAVFAVSPMVLPIVLLPTLVQRATLCSMNIVSQGGAIAVATAAAAVAAARAALKTELTTFSIAFYEAGLLVAAMSVTIWANYWDAVTSRPGSHSNIFTMLGPSVDAVLLIQVLIAWIQPWFIAMHAVTPCTLVVVWQCRSQWKIVPGTTCMKSIARSRNHIFPAVCVILLVHIFMSMALSAIVYRAGQVDISFLNVTVLSNSMSIAVFLVLLHVKLETMQKHPGASAFLNGIILSSQLIMLCYLIGQLTLSAKETSFWFILAVATTTSITSAVGAFALAKRAELELSGNKDDDTHVAALSGEIETGDTAPLLPPHDGVGEEKEQITVDMGQQRGQEDRTRTASPLVDGLGMRASSFWRCACEVPENAARRIYGARIKWRRACLVAGALCMCLSAIKGAAVLGENTKAIAWAELQEEFKTYGGDGTLITPSNTSFLEPIVASYASIMRKRSVVKIVYACAFMLAAAADLYRSSIWWLRVSRLCGFVGALGCIVSIFLGFTPDYVNQLDFQHTLGRCGQEFCKVMSNSARAGFSTIMVAQAGTTFVPILVSMPWTLGRIAFFLAVDRENDTSIVTALLWGAVSAIFRLTLLPITIVYLYRPNPVTTTYYAIFLACSSFVLIFIVNKERIFNKRSKREGGIPLHSGGDDDETNTWGNIKHLVNSRNFGWYLVWGWGAFLLPLMKVASVALDDTISSLFWRLIKQLFSAETWQDTVSEFVLSDVVISDMLYMTMDETHAPGDLDGADYSSVSGSNDTTAGVSAVQQGPSINNGSLLINQGFYEEGEVEGPHMEDDMQRDEVAERRWKNTSEVSVEEDMKHSGESVVEEDMKREGAEVTLRS